MNPETLPTLSYQQLKACSGSTSLTLISPSTKKHNLLQSPDVSSLYSQTLFNPSPKRQRPCDSTTTENKKSKCPFGPVTKLATELFDTETCCIMGFRCFREHEIIFDQSVSDNVIRNECDDDCTSDELQIKAGSEYMRWELEDCVEGEVL